MKASPPGPRSLLSGLRLLQQDFLPELLTYGNIVRFQFLLWPATLIVEPEYVKQVLTSTKYDKDVIIHRALASLLGQGIFLAEGESWKSQRRLMQPIFQPARLTPLLESSLSQKTRELLEHWHGKPQPIDIHAELIHFSVRVLTKSLFHSEIDDDAFVHGFEELLPPFSNYIKKPFPPLSVPTPTNRHIQRLIRRLDETLQRIILQRRNSVPEQPDLLSLLMAPDETGKVLDAQLLRDEIMALILGGYETTANLITWACAEMAEHPEIETRLLGELHDVLHHAPLHMEHLKQLPYLTKVLHETLRLHTPTFLMARHAREEDQLGGYIIPKNSIVFLSPYYTHRQAQYWENPEHFDPERFDGAKIRERPRYAFFPFGGGNRQCIGNQFAFMEAQYVFASIMLHYRLSLAGERPQEVFQATLRPKNGLPMFLEERHTPSSKETNAE